MKLFDGPNEKMTDKLDVTMYSWVSRFYKVGEDASRGSHKLVAPIN